MQGGGIPLSKDRKNVTEKQEALVLILMSEVEAANNDLSTDWEQALWVNCYLLNSLTSYAMEVHLYTKGHGNTMHFVSTCVFTLCN